MANSKDRQHAGKLRQKQDWIGGSVYNPCTVAFVPPPPGLVPDLLTDLCSFCNTDSLPAVAQAALAHAQFETVHPFADGKEIINAFTDLEPAAHDSASPTVLSRVPASACWSPFSVGMGGSFLGAVAGQGGHERAADYGGRLPPGVGATRIAGRGLFHPHGGWDNHDPRNRPVARIR